MYNISKDYYSDGSQPKGFKRNEIYETQAWKKGKKKEIKIIIIIK